MGIASCKALNLKDFDVCPYMGFAASDGALLSHLDPYYEPWENVLSSMPQLLASKRLRQAVRALPLLSIDTLKTDAEKRRAYLTLALLVQAYVFEDAKEPDAIVPAAISEPFLSICAYWGLQPILSHIGFCLWNWKIKTIAVSNTEAESFDTRTVRRILLQDLNNVECCGSFTNTVDEKTFAMVPLLVEAEGGTMIPLLLNAIEAASVDDVSSVTAALKTCVSTLSAMSEHLQVLHSQCDPQIFFDTIRPFIAGSQGMESKGLIDGFVFSRSDGTRVSSKCVGASAGQSSIFQFLDIVFGIEHKSAFLRELRLYMPRKHRGFLEAVEQLPTLRDFVQTHPESIDLHTVFELCVAQLRAWRTRHVGLAVRYIAMPAKRQVEGEAVKGTGGSLPIPFLKETRDETV